MRGLNKVQIIGNVGADPEIRYTQAGTAVANVRVATNFTYKDRSGEKHESTEWHRVVAFGKLAELVQEYVHQGSPIYFEGRLRTREWEKDGVKRYSTEIIAAEMILLGGNRNGNGNGTRQPAGQAANGSGWPASEAPASTGEDFDDEIPF